MSFEIKTIDDFQKYLTKASERADHHGEDVNEAVFILAGLIVIYKDPEAKIEVRTYNGAPANILRTTVGGTPYAFAYNHETQEIEIRDRTEGGDRGEPIASITNTTPIKVMRRILNELRTKGA